MKLYLKDNRESNKNLQATSYKLQASRAFGLIEIVIAVSIITVGFALLFNVAVLALRLADESNQRIQAANLLEEGYEAIRAKRESSFDWNSFRISMNPGLGYRCLLFDENINDYVINVGECEIGNGFTRKMYTKIALREGGILNEASGVQDNNAILVVITAGWGDGAKSEDLKFYLTNFSE